MLKLSTVYFQYAYQKNIIIRCDSMSMPERNTFHSKIKKIGFPRVITMINTGSLYHVIVDQKVFYRFVVSNSFVNIDHVL
jgi:hypothetical protein